MDWTKLKPPSAKNPLAATGDIVNLILGFTPIDRNQVNSFSDAKLDESVFLIKTFDVRYRNSEEILEFSKFLIEKSNRCMKFQEKRIPCHVERSQFGLILADLAIESNCKLTFGYYY